MKYQRYTPLGFKDIGIKRLNSSNLVYFMSSHFFYLQVILLKDEWVNFEIKCYKVIKLDIYICSSKYLKACKSIWQPHIIYTIYNIYEPWCLWINVAFQWFNTYIFINETVCILKYTFNCLHSASYLYIYKTSKWNPKPHLKELSICNKLWFSNPNIFLTWWQNPLIFQT